MTAADYNHNIVQDNNGNVLGRVYLSSDGSSWIAVAEVRVPTVVTKCKVKDNCANQWEAEQFVRAARSD